MKKLIIILLGVCITGCSTMPSSRTQAVSNQSVTSDQQGILHTLRTEVKKRYGSEPRLTVHYLKTHNGWAYVETTGGGDPGVNAVLKKVNNKWLLVKTSYPCSPICPGGMSTCADGELVCTNTLHKQFPDAPISIFPTSDYRSMVINP